MELFPSVYVTSEPSINISPTADGVEYRHAQAPALPEHLTVIPKPRKQKRGQVPSGGRWWEDKTPEERAEIIKRRTASRHANVAKFPPEARPKSAWGTVGAGLSKKTRNAKHQARLQIKNLQAHGITPSPELFQRAMDGVTPAQKQRIPNAQRKPSAP